MPDTFRVDVDDSRLRFSPNDSKFLVKLQGEIPAFAQYESEFVQTDSAKRRIFSWIIIMYDPYSPLRREILDLYQRKVYAANICGIKPHAVSGKFRDYVEKILVGEDKDINNLIVKFIASFSSPEYTQLMAHVSIQHDMLERIIARKADKNVQALFDAATEKIKELTNLLYGTGERDEVYEARRALYKQVAYDLSDMRPEKVARTIIEEGDLPPEWSPYGDEYKLGDIHFVGDDPEMARDDEEQLPPVL